MIDFNKALGRGLSGDQIKAKHNTYRADSYGFNGRVAPAAIRNKFLGGSVKKLFKHGDRTPVRVFICLNEG